MFLKGFPSVIGLFSSSIALRLAAIALGFVNSIIINRYLGVELRGEYTTILNYANLIQLFLNLGIGNSFPAFRRGDPDRAVSVFINISFAQLIGNSLIAVLVVGLSDNSSYTAIAIIAIVMVLENQMTFISLVENIIKRNITQLLVAIAYTVALGIVYAIPGHSLELILTVTALNSLVNSLCLLMVCVNRRELRISLGFRDVFAILKVSIPTMLMNVLMFCNYNIDIILLDMLTHDNYQIGLYGTAVFLGNTVWKIPDATKEVLYSRVARKDNPREILWCIILNCLVAIVIVVVFYFTGVWLLEVLYGTEFVAAYDLVLLLFIGTIPMIFYKLIHPIYIANKRPGVVVGVLLIAVVANIAGNMMLIPIYSATGSAIASVVSYSVCGVICLIKFVLDYRTLLFGALKRDVDITKRG